MWPNSVLQHVVSVLFVLFLVNPPNSCAWAQEPKQKLIDSLNARGKELFEAGDYHSALECHREALQLANQISDRKHIIETLMYLAQCELQVEQYDSSENHVQQMLEMTRSTGERKFELDALRLRGDANYRRGRYEAAKRDYLQALKIAESMGDSTGSAHIVHNLGNVYADKGQFDVALEYYERALTVNRSVGDVSSVGKSLLNVGLVHLQIGNYAASLAFLDSAASIFDKISDKTNLGTTLVYLGTTYNALANYPTALEYLEKGLDLARVTKDTFSVAVVYGSMGDVELNLGNYTRGLQYHLKASSIFQMIRNPYNVSASYTNIGAIYRLLGDYDKALDWYRRALSLKEEIGEEYGIGITLGDMGDIYLERDSIGEALSYFRHSLEIGKRIGDKPTTGRAYKNLGSVFSRLKRYKQAEQSLQEAFRIFRSEGMKSEEADALNNLGDVRTDLRDFAAASGYYKTAHSIGTHVGDPECIWRAETGLGVIAEARNDLSDAVTHYRAAIDILEGVRLQIGTGEYRSSFLAAQFSPYESLIEVLGKMHVADATRGYDREAFRIAERSKARSFVELLVESKADIRSGLSNEQKLREREIVRHIAQLQSKLMRGVPAEAQKKGIVDQIAKEEENLEHLQTELRQVNAVYADLKHPHSVDLLTVQHKLLSDTSLLAEFSLGKKHSYLWLVSKDHARMIQLPPSDRIERQTRVFLNEINKRPATRALEGSLLRVHELGKSLFRTLFGQAVHEITSTKHLIIVPDGILFYLPFESLPVQNQPSKTSYLVTRVPISYVQSATVLAQLRGGLKSLESDKELELLAFGDPVFPQRSSNNSSDSLMQTTDILVRGLEDLGHKIEPLPSTREEVQAIAAHFPEGKVKVCLGEKATETNVKAENLALYRYIHFATHGFLDEKAPGRSGLLLSMTEDSTEDGLLQMNEIFNLDMNADVIVLSACETGLGKLLKGEGMVGLTRAFHYAGAQSLVVSLWKVADASTATLMSSFYSSISTTRSPACALREAKLMMLESPVKLWRHPFHWAGFVVEGKGN